VDVNRCYETKVTFYTKASRTKINKQFDDYFKDLVPLAEDWMDLLTDNFPMGTSKRIPVTFDRLLDILDKHIRTLAAVKEPTPEHLLRQRVMEQSKKELEERHDVIQGMEGDLKKRGVNEMWTIEGGTVKRSKQSSP
jgi:hypothetical protein